MVIIIILIVATFMVLWVASAVEIKSKMITVGVVKGSSDRKRKR